MFLFQILTFIHFLNLAVYFLVAGQFIFYQLCFSHVFKQIDARNFLDIRKIADPILQVRLSIIYTAAWRLEIQKSGKLQTLRMNMQHNSGMPG